MVWAYVQTLIALIVVCALMVGLVYFLRRFMYGSRLHAPSLVTIDILGSKMLQPKVMIYVLRIENKIIVVGLSERGLHLLTELEGELPVKPEQGNEEQPSPGFKFLQVLKKNLGLFNSAQ